MQQRDVSRTMHCFLAMRHAISCTAAEPCLLRTPYLRAPETLAESEQNHPNYVFLSRCENWKHVIACRGITSGCTSSTCAAVCNALRYSVFHVRSCRSDCKLRKEYAKIM